jgi:hypothetical protein
MDLLD